MAGISPKLPITKDTQDGYALTKSYLESSRQNLKNLLLTVPGERMMDPDFGVGMKTYLFEEHSPMTYGNILSKIISQVSIYMPFIDIQKVDFYGPDGLWTSDSGYIPGTENETADLNLLQIKIFFLVVPLGQGGTLDLDFAV
jgi:phage baseplate assembly protein W